MDISIELRKQNLYLVSMWIYEIILKNLIRKWFTMCFHKANYVKIVNKLFCIINFLYEIAFQRILLFRRKKYRWLTENEGKLSQVVLHEILSVFKKL